MKLYWVSAIIQNTYDRKPWLCAMDKGELSLDKAMKIIAHIKRSHNVISAWIDVFDKNNVKQTIFHECYIDAFGDKYIK